MVKLPWIILSRSQGVIVSTKILLPVLVRTKVHVQFANIRFFSASTTQYPSNKQVTTFLVLIFHCLTEHLFLFVNNKTHHCHISKSVMVFIEGTVFMCTSTVMLTCTLPRATIYTSYQNVAPLHKKPLVKNIMWFSLYIICKIGGKDSPSGGWENSFFAITQDRKGF